MIRPGIDHIALTVPDLEQQIDRLITTFGMAIESRTSDFAVITDTATGLKLELGRSSDDEVHVRHIGFRADDVNTAHDRLVDAGMETARAPHRRDDTRMYTSFLKQPGGVEVQLVNYDSAHHQ
ncbi:MAG: VOC family protein [Ilumatobacteraceae bacterium]